MAAKKGPSTAKAGTPVQAPFQGVFLDRPPHIIPPQGFSACNNVRVRFSQIWFKDMGWLMQIKGSAGGAPLFIPSAFAALGIVGGGLFTLTTEGYQYLIVITQGDIYACAFTAPPTGFINVSTFHAAFITPVYGTGTVDCDGAGNLTGHGTLWNTPIGGPGSGFRKNMRPGDYIAFGATGITDPGNAVTWFQIATVSSDTSATLTTSGTVQAGVAYTLRQTMSNGVGNSRPVMEEFPNAGGDNQDLLFIANGAGSQRNVPSVDPIVVWNPTQASATYLSSFGFTCGRLRRFNNVMIYGRLWGVSGATPLGWLGSTSIQSSDNGLPKSVNTGVVFQGVVSDGPEPIQHLGVMGNQLLIYTGGQAPNTISTSMSPGQGGSVISASFVGLPTVWQFSTVIRGRSTIGQGLVAEFADRHQFLGQDGEYRYNGMFLQVMNDHVFRQVVAAVDYPNIIAAFNIIDTQAGEIMWVLPTSANGTNSIWACYVEHYMEQANNYLFKPITIRDAADQNTLIAWQAFLGTAPNRTVVSVTGRKGPLIGDSSGNIIQIGLGAGNTQTWGNGSAIGITETCTFAARIIAGERARGLVKRVYPFVDEVDSSGTSLTVSAQLWDRVGAATAITDTKTYTTGTATRFTTHYRRGRVGQVQFTFSSTASGLNLILDGYDVDLPMGSPGGQR